MTHHMVAKVKRNATIPFPKVGMAVLVRNKPNRPLPPLEVTLRDNRSAASQGKIVEIVPNFDNTVIIVEHHNHTRAVYWLDEADEVFDD